MNLLWGKIRHSIGLGLDLLYPPRCGGCGAAGQGWWCPACAAATAPLGEAGITRARLDDGRTLLEIAWARFEPPLREGIHALKYGGSPLLAAPFGESMARAWQAGAGDWAADAIAPVPLHAARKRERGYNQSERLAEVVARIIECPLERVALSRPRATAQQALLDREARQANVAGAFVARPERVSGRRVLVIDDVYTTGA
ncbi:MAG: double zinc ribbon domain-containing protein, partial [Thermoflexales bacterium]